MNVKLMRMLPRPWFTSMVDRPQRIDSLSILVQVDLSSCMVHGSVENESDIDRFTIALNTFPSGVIAFDRPMAEVSVNGWTQLDSLNL